MLYSLANPVITIEKSCQRISPTTQGKELTIHIKKKNILGKKKSKKISWKGFSQSNSAKEEPYKNIYNTHPEGFSDDYSNTNPFYENMPNLHPGEPREMKNVSPDPKKAIEGTQEENPNPEKMISRSKLREDIWEFKKQHRD